jgi:hypothetical protein
VPEREQNAQNGLEARSDAESAWWAIKAVGLWPIGQSRGFSVLVRLKDKQEETHIMSKKLFISFAPLLAIAAFAVMPVAAQAAAGEGHWFVGGSILKEGVKTPTVTWGGSTNLSQTSNIGEINCRGVGGGTIENPKGGTAGVGTTDLSNFFECKSLGCEKAAGETGLPLTSYAITNAGERGWANKITGTSPEFNQTIGEEFTAFTTYPDPTTAHPHEIMALVTCETPPGFEPHVVGVAATFQGELKPKIGPGQNGTSSSKPSAVTFSGASTGALHSSIGGEGTNSGQVKYEAYNTNNLVTVE